MARYRPLDLGGLAFLRARARSLGGGPTPIAERLGACHSPCTDANHGSATATLADLKWGVDYKLSWAQSRERDSSHFKLAWDRSAKSGTNLENDV